MGRPVVILGAGPAGLAAAWKLAEAGRQVVVLEQQPFVGGMGATQHRNGLRYDFGPHAFHDKPGEVMPLVRSLVGEELLTGPINIRLLLENRLYRYPLKLEEVIRKMNLLTTARIFLDFTVVSLLYQFISAPDDNFESWGVKRFGKTLYDLSFGYYSGKVWGIPPSEISRIFARGKLLNPGFRDIIKRLLGTSKKEFYWKTFLYPRQGSGTVYDRLAARIEAAGGTIVRGAEVMALRREGERVRSVSYTRHGAQNTLECEAVVSTILLADLVPAIAPTLDVALLHAANRLRLRSLILVYILLDVPKVFDFHWAYLVDKRFRFNRCSEPKNLSGEMMPSHQTLLCFEVSCNAGDELWRANDEEVVRMLLEDIKRFKVVEPKQIAASWCHRLDRAYNVYDVDFEHKMDLLLFGLGGIPNLVTIGRKGLFLQNDMHDSMAMGLKAAQLYLQQGSFAHAYNHLSPYIEWR